MLDLFRRMILGGGDNEGNPPVVTLVWGAPLSGTGDQNCNQSVCNYIMLANATDADNDIAEYLFQVSTDLGNTWVNRKVGTQADLTDTINSGEKWYRVIVKDSEGAIVISNIIKMKKLAPTEFNLLIVPKDTGEININFATRDYILKVRNQTFNGYIALRGSKVGSVHTPKMKDTIWGNVDQNIFATAPDEDIYVKAISLPIGDYNSTLLVRQLGTLESQPFSLTATISYGYSESIDTHIQDLQVNLDHTGIDPPE